MLPDPGTIVTIVGLSIAGLVWLVRLEGRQNSHERECIQYRKLVDERHAGMTKTLDAMNEKLDRLVERVS